jgi:hypothetical protein
MSATRAQSGGKKTLPKQANKNTLPRANKENIDR